MHIGARMPLGGSSHLPIPHFVPVPPYELGLRGSKNCAHLSRTRDMPELDVVRWRRQAVWTGRGGKEGQGVNLPLSLQRLLLRVSGGGLCCPPSSLCDPVATRKRTGGHGINSWLPRASQPTALSARATPAGTGWYQQPQVSPAWAQAHHTPGEAAALRSPPLRRLAPGSCLDTTEPPPPAPALQPEAWP